jgi:putative hydrolase of the HAD superfamily
MIEAVFFDLGGTLIDYGGKSRRDEPNTAGLKNVYEHLERAGEPLPSFEAFSKRLNRALKLGWLRLKITSRELDAPAVVRKTLAKMNISPSDEELEKIGELWYQPFSEHARLLPGAKEVLTELKERNIDLGIISNTPWKGHLLMGDLETLGILDFFDLVVFSSETTIRKPAGALFEHASVHIGHERAACMMVGDHLEDDVYGALNAGMSAVLVGTRFERPAKYVPYYEIEKLPQLLQAVDELNASEKK